MRKRQRSKEEDDSGTFTPPSLMSTPGYNEERIKAIEARIAELQLIKEKLLLMKKDLPNDSKDSVRH